MKASPLILAIIILTACSSESNPTAPSTDVILEQGVSLEIVQGDRQIAAVTDTLPDPCIVEVRAPGGAQGTGTPISGVLVNFVVTEGGGHVYAGSAITDSIGRAADLWILGTAAGDQQMEVRAVTSEGTPVVYKTFEATAEPGPPAELDIDVNSIRAFVNQPVLLSDWITCEDQYGNAVRWTSGDVNITTDHEFISIAGDTLISNSEAESTVRLSVGDLSIESPLYIITDLTGYDWTISYALIDSVGIDSITVSMESTAVEYYSGTDVWPWESRLAFSMTFDAHYTCYWSDGHSTETDTTGLVRTFCQGVGSLAAAYWNQNGFNGCSYGGIHLTSIDPMSYQGDSTFWLHYGNEIFSSSFLENLAWGDKTDLKMIGTPKP